MNRCVCFLTAGDFRKCVHNTEKHTQSGHVSNAWGLYGWCSPYEHRFTTNRPVDGRYRKCIVSTGLRAASALAKGIHWKAVGVKFLRWIKRHCFPHFPAPFGAVAEQTLAIWSCIFSSDFREYRYQMPSTSKSVTFHTYAEALALFSASNFFLTSYFETFFWRFLFASISYR